MISARATIIGAIERKESRRVHQRTDVPDIDSSLKINFVSKLNADGKLVIDRKEIHPMSPELRKMISQPVRIEDFKGKLLE